MVKKVIYSYALGTYSSNKPYIHVQTTPSPSPHTHTLAIPTHMVADECGHTAIEATGVSHLTTHSLLPAEEGGHLGVPSLHQLFLCLLHSVSDHQRTEVLCVHRTTRPGEEEEEEERGRQRRRKEGEGGGGGEREKRGRGGGREREAKEEREGEEQERGEWREGGIRKRGTVNLHGQCTLAPQGEEGRVGTKVTQGTYLTLERSRRSSERFLSPRVRMACITGCVMCREWKRVPLASSYRSPCPSQCRSHQRSENSWPLPEKEVHIAHELHTHIHVRKLEPG